MIHVGYGIDEANCDKFIPLAEEAIEHVNKGGEAGEFLVEELPERSFSSQPHQSLYSASHVAIQ